MIFVYDLGTKGHVLVYVTNTSKDNKSHVDRDVTFRSMVTRKGHVIGNSWNDFLDLKNLGKNKTFIAVGQIQAEITKVT